ncbi:unnamed protein product [Gadus morhua 'NCC']
MLLLSLDSNPTFPPPPPPSRILPRTLHQPHHFHPAPPVTLPRSSTLALDTDPTRQSSTNPYPTSSLHPKTVHQPHLPPSTTSYLTPSILHTLHTNPTRPSTTSFPTPSLHPPPPHTIHQPQHQPLPHVLPPPAPPTPSPSSVHCLSTTGTSTPPRIGPSAGACPPLLLVAAPSRQQGGVDLWSGRRR